MNRNGTGQRYTFHNVIWRAFQAAGLSRRDIALQAGLSAEVATGQMVTCRQFFAIWDAISSLSGDLGIGFRVGKMAGEPSDNPAVYALLPAPFASAIHAGNFVDAAQRIARIKSLCAPEDMFVEDLGDRVIFSLKPHCIEETGPEIPEFPGGRLFLRNAPPPAPRHGQRMLSPCRGASPRPGKREVL